MATNALPSNERFLDVNNEPQKPLGPIEGYELKPLLSLKEAVETLQSIIPSIQSYVWSTLGNCEEQPKDGLSIDESGAIHLYTTECLHRQLNAVLRSAKRQHLIPYFSYLKLLLTALWKLTDFKGVVWRGVKGDLKVEYSPKTQFFWWGLSSCTKHINILQSEEFLGETGARTLFSIECYNGKLIQNHSCFPDECEVLLLPCSYFEVIGNIEQNNNLRIIPLRQIEPPCVMIQSPCNFPPPTTELQSPSSTESMTDSLSHVSVVSTLPPFTTKPKKDVSTLMNLNVLKQKPTLSMSINRDCSSMDGNEKYLVYCPKRSLSLLNEQGNEKLHIRRDYEVWDICWASYLSQFLILSPTVLYLLDITASKTQQIKGFSQPMWSCTCYEETFIVSSCSEAALIEEYSLSNWKPKRTYHPPLSCQENQYIRCIRFSSSGTHLGVMLSDKNHPNYRLVFELRGSNDMNVLQVTDIGVDRNCWLLSLPNRQFLVNTLKSKKFYLLDSNGQLKETIPYDAKQIWSTASFNGTFLLIQTEDPSELRFYDITR
ncbi:unnamed protein product [Didymodactylos carnosus]|uniref:NAD(P)(+)--arginine ADP-ribosyltransferase n=1 Tax=Didymodactylos carnosus TaxID=1234261 RepID=A0A814V6Z4_9BILA|nr:unnamed protein product [Didymodactylos carnosus]CAF1327197.1 unnamed protein product [Didymodactylos carnosus]CAF3947237.1 unnamed protein product [Didymodactylos carnosus]CAF4138640.1 unnamed protein product [Didymodactylos carnosus]